MEKGRMSEKKSAKRNVAIAIGVIVILIIAGFALYFIINGNFSIGPTNPLDFSISLSSSSATVMQGNSIHVLVNVAYLSGTNTNVALSGDSGSSGIQCSFDPTTNTPSFTSTLTMSVPDSTPTAPYSVIVTGTAGKVTHTTSFTVSVLSAEVYVSGTVTTTGFGTSPTQIQFVDQQTGLTYTGALSGTSYSISLQNEHSYTVTVYWQGLLYSSGTYSGGTLYVYAPVGYTTQTQDFSG
jgi:hypothetical protein